MTRQRAGTAGPRRPGATTESRTARVAAAVAGRYDGIEKAALTAAVDLLASGGVKSLTIEGVAARTGIAKTTLYRRWRSKEDLALAVVLEMARLAASAPAGVAGLVQHGVAKGELRGDVDLPLPQERLFGPVYYRLLFSRGSLHETMAEQVVDSVLPAMRTRPGEMSYLDGSR